MKILLVDEDTCETQASLAALRAEGHQVHHAVTVGHAILAVRTAHPDLVISTLFPEGEGAGGDSGLTVAMAAQIHNPDLALILLSDSAIFAHGELFSMLSSLRCVLSHPIQVADLVEIVRYVLPVRSRSTPAPARPDFCGACLLASVCGRASKNGSAVQVGTAVSGRGPDLLARP